VVAAAVQQGTHYCDITGGQQGATGDAAVGAHPACKQAVQAAAAAAAAAGHALLRHHRWVAVQQLYAGNAGNSSSRATHTAVQQGTHYCETTGGWMAAAATAAVQQGTTATSHVGSRGAAVVWAAVALITRSSRHAVACSAWASVIP
jgi:hypothetical protein